MMTAQEFSGHLSALRLPISEASQLLGVSDRTLRRWLEGEEIPGPAEAALRAWTQLNARNLPWKPDAISVFDDDQDQIERHRRHTQEMVALLHRVEARGGPKNPWTVDLSKNTATFGPFEVGLYRLQSGAFSLSNYRRADIAPDITRDMPFIEDAAYCISKAFGKARASGPALIAVAEYTRQHSSIFARSGPKLLSAAETNRRRREIEALADKIDAMAGPASEGRATYAQFEALLSDLHKNGFFPEISLISAVAHAMV
jgi:hypothetical protein